MSETRSSNFECLRILAIILILIMHSYAQANCKENLFNLFVGYVISAIGNIGVSCFVLLSGYFGVKFRHCPRFCVNRKLEDSSFILESCFQI